MKKLYVLLILSLAFASSPMIAKADRAGGGGDATEMGVDLIRADILKWIKEGGAKDLKNWPQGMAYDKYALRMTKYLVPHFVVVGFVTTYQENHTIDPEQQVIVDGERKSCRGFRSIHDRLPHILCNTDRYPRGGADQYRLIHHEFAGLAGVERNIGASSDYTISNQLTDYLVPETVLRLGLKPITTTSQSNSDWWSYGIKELEDVEKKVESCRLTEVAEIAHSVLGRDVPLAVADNSQVQSDAFRPVIMGSFQISPKSSCNLTALYQDQLLSVAFTDCRLNPDDEEVGYLDRADYNSCDIPSIKFWVKRVNDGYDQNGDPINPRFGIKKIWLETTECTKLDQVPLVAETSDGDTPTSILFNMKRYRDCLTAALPGSQH